MILDISVDRAIIPVTFDALVDSKQVLRLCGVVDRNAKSCRGVISIDELRGEDFVKCGKNGTASVEKSPKRLCGQCGIDLQHYILILSSRIEEMTPTPRRPSPASQACSCRFEVASLRLAVEWHNSSLRVRCDPIVFPFIANATVYQTSPLQPA